MYGSGVKALHSRLYLLEPSLSPHYTLTNSLTRNRTENKTELEKGKWENHSH